MGLCMMGELWALRLGETARRLNDMGSKSSSRRRLLFIRRVISAAVGSGCWGPGPGPGADVDTDVDVDVDRAGGMLVREAGRLSSVGLTSMEEAPASGESMAMSSLKLDMARGRIGPMGGVVMPVVAEVADPSRLDVRFPQSRRP